MTTRKVYFLSLAAVQSASVYPIIMGVRVLAAYIKFGGVDASNYPKYVIPYTPICIALIISVALLPLIVRLCKKFALLTVSLLALALFFGAELGFEKIVVFGGTDIQSWQLYMCAVTPQVQQTIGDALTAQYSPAFKIHFYVISALIILSVITVIHGYLKMVQDKMFDKKVPLITQLISVCVFIGLCILACFTAFYRTGELTVSPLSAFLMILFFIVFGAAFGVYAGTLLYGRKTAVAIVIPSVIAVLAAIIMYIGELVLLGGVLYKFGDMFLFTPLIGPFAVADILVILLSGAIAFLILFAIRKRNAAV